ncbi:MAG: hypothetical protein ACREC6_06055 [Hyphomicrobiaceae bacterium]
MDDIAEIEDRGRKFTPDEMARFRAWFIEFDANRWDEEIANDLAAGKLDGPIEEAIADRKVGKAPEL